MFVQAGSVRTAQSEPLRQLRSGDHVWTKAHQLRQKRSRWGQEQWGGCTCVGTGVTWESVPSPQFFCEPKTLAKILSLLKKSSELKKLTSRKETVPCKTG